MDKETIRTRNKIKQIGSMKDFELLLNSSVLSDEEKKIIEMHYKEQKTLTYIADVLGMSEATVKRKHKKVLMKLGKFFS